MIQHLMGLRLPRFLYINDKESTPSFGSSEWSLRTIYYRIRYWGTFNKIHGGFHRLSNWTRIRLKRLRKKSHRSHGIKYQFRQMFRRTNDHSEEEKAYQDAQEARREQKTQSTTTTGSSTRVEKTPPVLSIV